MKKRSKLAGFFMNNLGLKILAVLFSVVVWMVAVNINDPVQKQSFSNIQVELKNTSVLTGEKKTYQVLDDTNVVTVTVRASRSVLEGINEENIKAVADFNELTYANTVPIKLSVNKYADRQIESVIGNIESVKLSIEDQKSKQLIIEVVTTGDPKKGYIVGRSKTTDGNSLKITGPESAVNRVTRAVVEADLTDYFADIDMEVPIRLLDAEGEEVVDNSIVQSATNSRVSVTILETREVAVVYGVSGEPAAGYALTGESACTPEAVMIAGKSSVIKDIDSVIIPPERMSVEGAVQDVTMEFNTADFLPEGVVLADPASSPTIVIVEKVAPVLEKKMDIDTKNIEIRNQPEGYHVQVDTQNKYSLTVRGLQKNLDQTVPGLVKAYIDLAAWMETQGMTQPAAGIYEIEVTFELPAGVMQTTPVNVSVELVEPTEQSEQE